MEAPMPMVEDGRVSYTPPSAVAAPNQRLMPAMTATGQPDFSQPMQMQVGGPLTAAQKRARALEGFESANPMVRDFAVAQYEKTLPKELDLKLAPIDPNKVDMASVVEAQRTGDIGKIKAREPAPETMTPYQKEQIRIEEEKLAFQKTKAGQRSDRPKPPAGWVYVDDASTDMTYAKGGPFDPERTLPMPASAKAQVVAEQGKAREFAIASQRTSSFIKDIEDGKLPLYKGASVVYAGKRAFGGDEEFTDETKPDYVRYYDLERFVTEQVNQILSNAKGPQTDADALRAKQQILDNLDNQGVVLSALRSLDKLWKSEVSLSEATVDDWYSQYNQERPTKNTRSKW
jgi:hypothetical protein